MAPLRRIDSMRALVRAHPQLDTARVILLTELARTVKLQNVQAARPVLEEAVRLARRVASRDLLAETLLDLADYHITLAEYPLAIKLLREARQEFARVHDLGGEVRCLGRLALVADQQGQYAASLSYCLQGLALPVTSGTRRFNTSLKIQAGGTFNKLGDYAHARDYLLDALQVARHQDYPDRINLALAGLGDVCRSQKQWAAARLYYTQSMALSQRLGSAPDVLAMQLNLAEVSERQGKFAEALALGYPALRQSIAAGQLLAIPRAQGVLARAFLRMGRPDSAIIYGQRSLQASQRVRFLEGGRAANEVLALAFAARKDFARAYVASIGRKVFNDSLLSEATTRRTAGLQLNFELGQKQAQIKLLTQQARLQNQQRELENLRQQNQLIGLTSLTLVAVVLASVLFWRYRRRQSARVKALRASLAADLRDDVGLLLRQISLQSNLLQEGLADAAGQRLQISRLSDASRTAVRQLNDVVWSLDAQNDFLSDLLTRMRDYAHEVLAPHGIELSFKVPDVIPANRLPARLRRNLYLIYKESLQSLVKHAAGATRVCVRIRLEGPQLVLDVFDNRTPALALSPAAADQPNDPGLANIDARATAMGGAATTGPDLAPDGTVTGFRVRVAVPLTTI
ncbi:hypothetical protein GCM10027511_20880 [Hymenobacter humi]